MDQASASPAASCACNPAEPRTSSSCSQSAGQSQTAARPPARSDPQCEPHAAPSNSRPRSSSPALCRLKAKRLPAAGFLLRRDREPGRFSEGLLLRRLHTMCKATLVLFEASSCGGAAVLGSESEGCLSPAVEAHEFRVKLTLHFAFLSSSTGARLTRRCALCRHFGLQNRAVER